MTRIGYDDLDVARLVPEAAKDTDVRRSPFERDRARVLHSAALRRLAGKTQVVGVGEDDFPRTRLTHSLECAQIGRGLAESLGADPDVVDAACLAHDLGHPPFGHNGEEALDEAAAACGGFEGNAQSLRILVRLEAKTLAPDGSPAGLNLTRATLDAATKYPWLRVTGKSVRPKWGAIGFDADRLRAIRGDAGLRWKAPKSFEAELMDWCDDVTYAVHDVVDFYRTGFIPLHRLFALSGGPKRRSVSEEADEFLSAFLKVNPAVSRNRARIAWITVAELSDFNSAWEPSSKVKAATQAATSQTITYFLEGLAFTDEPCRHNGEFLKDSDEERAQQKQLAVDLLQYMLRYFVIDRPALRSVQHGQATIACSLLEIYAGDIDLLPVDRTEEHSGYDSQLLGHGDRLRAATDHVASLTESEAQALYQRLTGHRLGSLTDAVYERIVST